MSHPARLAAVLLLSLGAARSAGALRPLNRPSPKGFVTGSVASKMPGYGLPPDPSLPYFPGVEDDSVIIPFGDAQPCPGDCDKYGARDVYAIFDPFDFEAPFKVYYDGSGPDAWLSCLATSKDVTLKEWTKKGTLLELGPKGSPDSGSASYLTVNYDINTTLWVGYYLATNQTSPPPGYVPVGPYYSMRATAPRASGPWTQDESFGLIMPTGSPGVVIPSPAGDGTFWQYCTGCVPGYSLGIATAPDLWSHWTPWVGLTQDPVENTALWFEPANGLLFLFTNHVGPDETGMAFDDAIWVYWSSNMTYFPPQNKAVVLNRTNVITPSFAAGRVGLPSLVEVLGSQQLAMIYDGGGYRDDVSYNENCSIALAWIDRPLVPPPPATAAKAEPQVEEEEEEEEKEPQKLQQKKNAA
jgi:hypothetical protein